MYPIFKSSEVLKRHSKKSFRFGFFFFLILTASFSRATDTTRFAKALKYKFMANAGAYFSNTTTNLRIDGNNVGIDFGLERDLGYNASGVGFRGEFSWQLSKRSSLMAYIFSINKKKSWDLEREITIRDTVLNPGVRIDSYFNIVNLGLDYRYSIFAKRTWQAGLAAGVKFLNLQMGFKGITNRGREFDQNYGITIPTISIGLHGNAYLIPNLLAKYNIDYFEVTIAGIEGRVISQRLSLEYFFLQNFGAGASYNYVTYKASDIPLNDKVHAQFLYTIYGLNIFASARF